MNTVNHRGAVYTVRAEQMAQCQRLAATWFTDVTHYQGRWVRCVRAGPEPRECRRMTSRVGPDGVGGECDRCAAIQTDRSYTKACYKSVVKQQKALEEPAATKMEMWMMKRKHERLVARITAMKATQFKVSTTQYTTAASLRGDLRVVASRLDNMAQQGLLEGRDANAMDFVRNIIGNLAKQRGPRGNRHNDATKALMGLLRKLGGAKAYGLVASNVSGLPCESTSHQYMRSQPFNAQL